MITFGATFESNRSKCTNSRFHKLGSTNSAFSDPLQFPQTGKSRQAREDIIMLVQPGPSVAGSYEPGIEDNSTPRSLIMCDIPRAPLRAGNIASTSLDARRAS